MKEWKQSFEEGQRLIEGLKEVGLTDADAERMERLLSFKSTPEERRRWIECGILTSDGTKLRIDESVTNDTFTIEVCLWNFVYTGIFIKTKDGYQRTGADGL